MNKPLVLRLKSSASVVVKAAGNDETLEIRGDLRALSSRLLDQLSNGLRQFCIGALQLCPEQVKVEHVLTINRTTGAAQFEWHVLLPDEVRAQIAAPDFFERINGLLKALTDDTLFDSPVGQDTPHLDTARTLRAAAPVARELPSGTRIDCEQWTTELRLPKKLGDGPKEQVVVKAGKISGHITGSDWYERVVSVLVEGHRRPMKINFDEAGFGDAVEDARRHRHNIYEVEYKSRIVNDKLDYSTLTSFRLLAEDLFWNDDGPSQQ